MGIWEAIEKLSELVDESDPDVSVSPTTALLATLHAVTPRACAHYVLFYSFETPFVASAFLMLPGCFRYQLRSGRESDLFVFS